MLQNGIQPKSAKSLLQRLIGIRLTRLPPLAAVALGMAASLSPATVHAQEYPWCLSREGYLYCFCKTREQSVDSIWHRRLRPESAIAVPEQAARF
jgi:hypothetical protein